MLRQGSGRGHVGGGERLDMDTFSLFILCITAASQKEGGPMGHPRRLKPSLVMGMSGGRRLMEGLPSSVM